MILRSLSFLRLVYWWYLTVALINLSVSGALVIVYALSRAMRHKFFFQSFSLASAFDKCNHYADDNKHQEYDCYISFSLEGIANETDFFIFEIVNLLIFSIQTYSDLIKVDSCLIDSFVQLLYLGSLLLTERLLRLELIS